MRIVRGTPSHRHDFYEKNPSFFDRFFIKLRRERPEFNRRMFDEDFSRIFCHYDRHKETLFEVTSSNYQLSDRLLGNVKTRYGPHPIDETIRSVVEDIAQSLIWFGEAYYFLHDDLEKEETHIASFSAKRIFSFGGSYFQFLPRRLERCWDSDDEVIGRELRILDRKKLMHFRLPRSIKRLLFAQNSILSSLDKHQHSSTHFLPKVTHEAPYPQNDFDFKAWQDSYDLSLYRATRRTGWNTRKHDFSKQSDFFNCYRMIRFRRNQLVLRDQILAQLGKELTRVGNHYQAGFRIEFSPTKTLPSIIELNNLEARLSREEASFTEVLDFCLKR